MIVDKCCVALTELCEQAVIDIFEAMAEGW